MNHPLRLLVLAFLGLASAAAQDVAPAPASAAPLPLTDNAAPPFFAVYRWGQGGVGKGLYDAYGPWLGRKVMWAEDFMPTEGWDKIEGQDWQLGTWKGWVGKQPGRRLVLSVPLLVGPWDKSGPKGGADAGPVSLAQGATGAYNAHFQRLAENLVKQNLGDTILRLGWEFNGGWYVWRAQKEDDAVAFAAYFQQIVKTMRAVPGAEKLKFCWNPAMEPWWPYSPEKAWPGDEFVDYVGVDVYDQSWQPGSYPIPDGADEAAMAKVQNLTWDNTTNNAAKMGLPYWVKFAAAHGKPLAIPEWGVCFRKDKHGGLDNPVYVENMFRFLHDPANNVYFHCYFDVGAPDGDHQLCPNPAPYNHHTTQFPRAATKYHELFSLPGNTAEAIPPADPATPAPKS